MNEDVQASMSCLPDVNMMMLCFGCFVLLLCSLRLFWFWFWFWFLVAAEEVQIMDLCRLTVNSLLYL